MFTRNNSTTTYGNNIQTTSIQTTISISQLNKNIIYAIAINDLDTVKTLVNSLNVNNIIDEKNKFTPLHIAIKKSDGSAIINYLLDIGADIDNHEKLSNVSKIDSYDLAFDHKKRCVFDYKENKLNKKIDDILIKNDTLITKISDLQEKNNYLDKINYKYSERIKTELEPIKLEVVTLKEQIKLKNDDTKRITKLYDEKNDECIGLKRKINIIQDENVHLKQEISESENALAVFIKKNKK